MTHGARFGRTLIFALALAAIMGHVCVVPGDIHAAMDGARHGHDDGDATTGGHGATGEGLHAGSCEALRPATVPAEPVRVVTASIVPLVPESRPCRRARADAVRAPAKSPPLYLTHRALLI